MTIEYTEAAIEDVMRRYVEGFKLKSDGKSIHDYEWFYDTAKGKVVFKLFIQDEAESATSRSRVDCLGGRD